MPRTGQCRAISAVVATLAVLGALAAHAADAPGPHQRLSALLHAQTHPSAAQQLRTRPAVSRPAVGTLTARVTTGTSVANSTQTPNHTSPTSPLHTALLPTTPSSRALHATTAILGGAPSAAITSRSATISGSNIHHPR